MARTPAPASVSAAVPVDVARLRLAIVRLARRQRQQSGTGLTPSLQSALSVIDAHGPLTLGALATTEQVAPPTTTRIVAKLEEMGLVIRTPGADDGRVTMVEATEEGSRQLAESRERRDAWLLERLAELPAEDVAALAGAIEPLERLLDVSDEPVP